MQGNASRERQYKRFSLFSREEYDGSDYFPAELFGEDAAPVHSVVLRPALADAVFPLLVVNRDIAVCRHIPVTLYLNGEYWRETYLCERYDTDYFKSHYGINDDNLIVIKEGQVEEGNGSDVAYYDEIFSYLDSHDMSDKGAYLGFCDLVDINNYIEYCCVNLYAANMDLRENRNMLLWRTRKPSEREGYKDGRWRWAVFDIDALDWVEPADYNGAKKKSQINPFRSKQIFDDYIFENDRIFSALKRNPDFCSQFMAKFMDMMDTDFSVENVGKVLSDLGEDADAYDSFFLERQKYMQEYLADEFGMEKQEK